MHPDQLFVLHLGPDPADLAGGTAAAPPPAEPVLDSTLGLSREQLAAPADQGADPGTPDAGAGTPAPAQPPPPGDPNLAAAVAPAAQPQAAQATTIRDAARAYGLDLSEFQDDASAWQYLIQAAQRATERNYYAELGQQIAPQYQQVQQYLQAQKAAQAQPAARPAWQHPEFDERWMQLVEKDPATGTYRAKAGVNPAFAEKVQQYADSLDGWTGGLTRQPRETLAPLIREVAAELIESRFGRHQQQAEAQQILSGNEAWLYQTDDQGRKRQTDDGRYLPSPLGARYYTHLQTLRAAGVSDSRALDGLAKQLLQGEILAARQPAAAAPAAVARPNVNPGQAVEPHRQAFVPGSTAPPAEGRSLADMLRQALAENGVTDADFQQVA